jgi:carboxyl-terminal processing protease
LSRRRAVPLLALLLVAPAAGQVPLAEVREALARYAVSRPSPATLAALDAADLPSQLRAIDPYARLMDAADHARERAGSLDAVGIGAALGHWDGYYVLTPYADGPLAAAGIQGPVRLRGIDGVEVTALPLPDVAARLRGEAGSAVQLDLAGPGQHRLDRVVRLLRQPFRASAVEPVTIGGRRVVRVRDFATRTTRTHLAVELRDLVAQDDAVVVDLRDSPGGDLFEALDAAALFVPPGAVLASTRDAAGTVKVYESPPDTKRRPSSLVLWVGPGTASAAEIFAGTLQQHGLARLVGARTFGKCSTQTDVPLSDGSVLRLTNREVLLPKGSSCSGAGLSPDVAVEGDALLDDARLLQASGTAR